jgi:hypothetical protein
MEEVELCLFPTLNDRQQGVKELTSIEIDAQAVHSAFEACDQLGISINVLLEAVWSLLLHHFTGLDNVRFASEEVAMSPTTGASTPSSVLCSIDISNVKRVSDLLGYGGERKRPRTSSPMTDDYTGSFNSSITVKYLANGTTKEHPLVDYGSVDFQASSTVSTGNFKCYWYHGHTER